MRVGCDSLGARDTDSEKLQKILLLFFDYLVLFSCFILILLKIFICLFKMCLLCFYFFLVMFIFCFC